MSGTSFPPPSSEDLETMTQQLGRPVRAVVTIAARMVDGTPIVAMTEPRLPDGTPFPTVYYLTEKQLTAAASRLEAEGFMANAQDLLATVPEFAEQYEQAHRSYLTDREELGHVAEIENVTAGGMPTRVKCLHALMAHSLAKGPGVNPVGDWALSALPEDLQNKLPETFTKPDYLPADQAIDGEDSTF